MNKNLLISTLFSSVLLFSTASKGADVQVDFNGNNQFTVSGVNFTGLDNLDTALGAAGLHPLTDRVVIADNTKRRIFDAIKVSGSAERRGFAELFSQLTGKSLNESEEFVNKAVFFIAESESQVPGFDELSLGSFDDFFNGRTADFIDLAQNLEKFGNVVAVGYVRVNRTKKIENKLYTQDTKIKELLDKKQVLEMTPPNNRGEDFDQKITRISKEIYAHEEFKSLRNDPITKEYLKNVISIVRSQDDKYKDVKKNVVSHLKQNSALYLELEPEGSSELPDIQKADNAPVDSMMYLLGAQNLPVEARIGSFAGVSAGDESYPYGFWVKASLTRGKQKSSGSNSEGYKLDSKGVTLGFDIGDDSLYGVAYSLVKSDVKNSANSDNKEDAMSHALTIYGKKALDKGFFLSGHSQIGMANIQKERATGDLANNIAKAKTKATTINAKVKLGYDANLNGIFITPTMGISYSNVFVKGYEESGNGLNRKVGKISADRPSAIAGIAVSYFVNLDSMQLIPEVHANLDYAIKAKDGKTVVTISDAIDPITTPAKKSENLRYNLGASVKLIRSESLDISAGYDLDGAKNFRFHTGTLKAKISF
jgi:outer membrane autotransporter protein